MQGSRQGWLPPGHAASGAPLCVHPPPAGRRRHRLCQGILHSHWECRPQRQRGCAGKTNHPAMMCPSPPARLHACPSPNPPLRPHPVCCHPGLRRAAPAPSSRASPPRWRLHWPPRWLPAPEPAARLLSWTGGAGAGPAGLERLPLHCRNAGAARACSHETLLHSPVAELCCGMPSQPAQPPLLVSLLLPRATSKY